MVLPEPDGPTIPTASPARTDRSTPRRMLTSPAEAPTLKRSRARLHQRRGIGDTP